MSESTKKILAGFMAIVAIWLPYLWVVFVWPELAKTFPPAKPGLVSGTEVLALISSATTCIIFMISAAVVNAKAWDIPLP